jgi:WD40 repeat protein
MTRLTDFDCLLSHFQGSEFVTVEDDGVNKYRLPQTEGIFESLTPQSRFAWTHSKFSLVRVSTDLVVASDTQCNIVSFTSNLQIKFIVNAAHSKIITDIQLITLPDQTYVASCSHDGYVKVWDMACAFRPIFEHTSSKKWCISMLYDPSTLVLTLNTEGKHFP